MKEYRVSLKYANKRFALSQDERVLRLSEFIKNVLRVRYFFFHHYKKEPIVINGDQMPLHRNESSRQKTMTLKDENTFVKENYMLSRERITVFAQVSSDPDNPLPLPEFVFKGIGKHVTLDPPEGVHVQWAPKGSYQLDTMLKTIHQLPNRYHIFRPGDYVLYILDDYSVHVTEEVRGALFQRGYILVCIGGGITGDIQVNDTHVHNRLKAKYRERECRVMMQQLQENSAKIPSPSRNDMIKMLVDSWKELDIKPSDALKYNFLTNSLDGREDYLVSGKLMEMVEEIKAFLNELINSPPPQNLRVLVKTITPPRCYQKSSSSGCRFTSRRGG